MISGCDRICISSRLSKIINGGITDSSYKQIESGSYTKNSGDNPVLYKHSATGTILELKEKNGGDWTVSNGNRICRLIAHANIKHFLYFCITYIF